MYRALNANGDGGASSYEVEPMHVQHRDISAVFLHKTSHAVTKQLFRSY